MMEAGACGACGDCGDWGWRGAPWSTIQPSCSFEKKEDLRQTEFEFSPKRLGAAQALGSIEDVAVGPSKSHQVHQLLRAEEKYKYNSEILL